MHDLDHETCYRAIQRRDARFDGRFYTAVTTTGIFCRPSCPARTPKSANVRFYPHAATASEAGFRPCRRCRPELAPGHPEWNRRADLTGRAITLIDEGLVDRVGVAGLARELGVSERHLRRELSAEIGTGPLQLARARRLWLARLLLDQTSLPVTDIAYAAGFGSLRQFNDSFQRAFDAPPSALRRRPGGPVNGSAHGPSEAVSLDLAARGPFGWEALHRFLAARAIPGLESSTPTSFRRRWDDGWIELSATADGSAVTLTCDPAALGALTTIVPVVRRVLDLDADLAPIAEALGGDPLLAERLDRVPLPRLPGAFDRFEVVVRAIVGQQVSVAGARTLLGRLVATCEGEAGRFPSPEAVAAADLDSLGMPGRRRATIQAAASAVVDGAIPLDATVDPDVLRAALEAIPGIGPWTAGYVAMRALSDPDGWPPGDLGLRRSAGLSATDLERRAERWRPWRAYAALHLWTTDPTQSRPATQTDRPETDRPDRPIRPTNPTER